jgi:hypothetical protein
MKVFKILYKNAIQLQERCCEMERIFPLTNFLSENKIMKISQFKPSIFYRKCLLIAPF